MIDQELLDDIEEEGSEDIITIFVPKDTKDERIDKYITSVVDMTRSTISKLVEEGRVLVNGERISKNYRLRGGESISIAYPKPSAIETLPQNIPLDIIYEDNDIIVVNKPSGMVVHPAPGNPDGTLVNALLYHCGDSLSGIGGVARPGIVHRIDKDTSGLIVVAKNDAAHLSLSEQLKSHFVSRIYYAVVCGNLKNDSGTVDAPIGRNPNDRKKMAVIKDTLNKSAKRAITHYTVAERFKGYTLVKCELETGRTHQIRVHMASLGHPILGDPIYGGDSSKFVQSNKALFKGQCLHAKELRLTHPTSGKVMKFECNIPPETEALIDKLRKMT